MMLKKVMTLGLLKLLYWRFLACVLVGVSSSIYTHTLEETSAQVMLRDGQVEVRIITDLTHLISIFQNNRAWLMGDIDTVMPKNLSIAQQESFIKKVIEKNMMLIVNEKVIGFQRITLKKYEQKDDGEIVLQAKHSFSEVTELSISFHKALGSVHVSFVEPQYKRLNAGEKATVVF